MIQGQQNCLMIGENWSPLVKLEDLSSIHKTHRIDQVLRLSYVLLCPPYAHHGTFTSFHNFFKKCNLKIVKCKIYSLWTIARLMWCFPTSTKPWVQSS